MIVIISVGAVLIAATYLLTKPPEAAAPPAPVQSNAVKVTDATVDAADSPDASQDTSTAATSTVPTSAVPTSTVPTTTAPASTAESASTPSTASPMEPLAQQTIAAPQIILSTHREDAKLLARATTASDPFTTVLSYKPFPSSEAKSSSKDPLTSSSVATKGMPPHKNGVANHHRIPPPPPGFAVPPPPSRIDMTQLPNPPAPPTVADKLKVVGIVGDKAIISVTDPSVRHEFKWSKMMTVGSGDMLGPVTVVAVKSDSVMFEEDGARTEKELAPVR